MGLESHEAQATFLARHRFVASSSTTRICSAVGSNGGGSHELRTNPFKLFPADRISLNGYKKNLPGDKNSIAAGKPTLPPVRLSDAAQTTRKPSWVQAMARVHG